MFLENKTQDHKKQDFVRKQIYKLALFHLTADTDQEVIWKMANILEENGITKKGFDEAISKREKDFPTGLPTDPIGVAIPHTDSCYVHTSQVAFASLKKPVNFRIMGESDGSVVPVSVVFMLALKNPEDQIEMLQKLVLALQDTSIINKLSVCSNDEEYNALLHEMNLI
ncbi:PTS sugar transporter subunit IIA [Bacillaceae bacterium Marseille-Q3522]|nr:PTS sugar transporter subunit IIA [Bacillaceae bacterium Marseille-Q3522]